MHVYVCNKKYNSKGKLLGLYSELNVRKCQIYGHPSLILFLTSLQNTGQGQISMGTFNTFTEKAKLRLSGAPLIHRT